MRHDLLTVHIIHRKKQSAFRQATDAKSCMDAHCSTQDVFAATEDRQGQIEDPGWPDGPAHEVTSYDHVGSDKLHCLLTAANYSN